MTDPQAELGLSNMPSPGLVSHVQHGGSEMIRRVVMKSVSHLNHDLNRGQCKLKFLAVQTGLCLNPWRYVSKNIPHIMEMTYN